MLRVCKTAVILYLINLCFFLFMEQIKYCFENSYKIFWVATISAGRSLGATKDILF